MVLVEKIGNIKAYAEKNGNRDYTITFINSSDVVAQETYFTDRIGRAIEDLALKVLDAYTEKWLYLNVPDLEKLTDNTYKSGEKDYFCRIDGTRFFKHF